MNIDHILLHLSLIETIGPAVIQKLLANFSAQNIETIYKSKHADFRALGLSQLQAEKLVEGLASKYLLEKELNLIAEHDISLLTIVDEEYPVSLKEIHLPPPVLYYQGIAPFMHKKNMAIVGSRQANAYGQAVIDSLVSDLIQAGWVIVSGGARGADTMAHKATLQAGGKTVAVLGSGLLKPYPPSNEKLFDAIKNNNGTVISAFPLQTEPLSGNFPARNRIIAGLSQGCVVVQAAEKSGAQITARYALEQGREVFAVPGSIFDPLSVGCHQLLQEGATLVNNARDILQQFGQLEFANISVPAKQVNVEVQQTCIVPEQPKEKILYFCKTPLHFDVLLQATQLSSEQASNLLFDLQIEGKVQQGHDGSWVISHGY